MRPFAYERPTTLAEAAALAARPDAKVLAGGTNLIDLMKLRVETPSLLVDVRRLLDAGITEIDGGGLRIGAGARNSEIAAHTLVRERYAAVAQALLAGASGQLRNLATAGGNLLQRTRCLYFQDTAKPCNKRAPGSGCSAREGEHRYLAILGASARCVATHPSDFAVALAAFDAVVETTRRSLPLTELYVPSRAEPERETVLEPGELITAIELPPTQMRSRYRKVRDRAAFAFALVSVAAAIDDGEVRIALGGVAPKPWRARRAEEALRSAGLTEPAIEAAMELELAEARPLPGNAFKTVLARRTVTATLMELA